MKLSSKLLITVFVSLFLIIAFSICLYASDIRYQYSEEDPYYHDIIINGQNVGKQPHRAETEATCITLSICHDCKAQFGDYAPHDFIEATCTNPKTCAFCDYQEGDPIPHSGGQAECMAQAKCEFCNREYGDPLGHIGGEPTCKDQAICTRCNEPYGKTLPHTGGVANCQSGAICTACGTAYGELGEHTVRDEWTIIEEFHYQTCSVEGCNEIFNDGEHMDETKDGKCDTCDYKYKLSQMEIILIITGISVGTLALVGIAAAGIMIIIKKKKQK